MTVSQTQYSQWFNQAQEMHDELIAEAALAEERAKELRRLAKRVATVLPQSKRPASSSGTVRKCKLCGQPGHRSDNCPDAAEADDGG